MQIIRHMGSDSAIQFKPLYAASFPQLALAGIRLAIWRGAVESIPYVHSKDFFPVGISSYQIKEADH